MTSNDFMLIIAPQFDEATIFSRSWAEWLAQKLSSTKHSYTLIPATPSPISRKDVEKLLLSRYKPVVFLDHGTEYALWCGHTEPCIDINNIYLVQDNIIYTVACQSAKKLGAKAYKVNNTYVGYIDNFIFTVSYQHLFRDASLSGLLLYVDGERDWRVIKQHMINSFNDATTKTFDPFAKALLIYDRNILRVYSPGVDDPKKDREKNIFQKICEVLRLR